MDREPNEVEQLLASLPLRKPRIRLHLRVLQPVGLKMAPLVAVALVMAVALWAVGAIWRQDKPSQRDIVEQPPSVPTLPDRQVVPNMATHITSALWLRVTSEAHRHIWLTWPPDFNQPLKPVPDDVRRQVETKISQLSFAEGSLPEELRHLPDKIGELVAVGIKQHRHEDGLDHLVVELSRKAGEATQDVVKRLETHGYVTEAAIGQLPDDVRSLVAAAVDRHRTEIDLVDRLVPLLTVLRAHLLGEAPPAEVVAGAKGVLTTPRVKVLTAKYRMVFSIESGQPWLSITDPEEHPIYDGSATGKEQYRNLPEELRHMATAIGEMLSVKEEALDVRPAGGAGRVVVREVEIRLE